MSRMRNKSGNGAKEMRISDVRKKIRGRLKQRVNTAKASRRCRIASLQRRTLR